MNFTNNENHVYARISEKQTVQFPLEKRTTYSKLKMLRYLFNINFYNYPIRIKDMLSKKL